MQVEGFGTMLLQTAPCLEFETGGARVCGQLCSWIMMKTWCPCMGCTVLWILTLRYSAHQEGLHSSPPKNGGSLHRSC